MSIVGLGTRGPLILHICCGTVRDALGAPLRWHILDCPQLLAAGVVLESLQAL
jgi:hypothetical protein